MSAPYHDHGLISRGVSWIRAWADEPSGGTAKYPDAMLLQLWRAELDSLLSELYAMMGQPPTTQFAVTLVAGQEHYKLPPNVQEVRRIAKLSGDTGAVIWDVTPRNPRSPYGPGLAFNGVQDFRVVPWPTSADTITFDYVPGATVSMHQNVAALHEGDNDTGDLRFTADTFRLNYREDTGYFVGAVDRRPNAFVGHRLRVLGTINDAVDAGVGCSVFPTQERVITNYDMYSDMELTVAPDFDSGILDATSTWADWTNEDIVVLTGDTLGRTYFFYEIVPDLDATVLLVAGVAAALAICATEAKQRKASMLKAILESRKRTLMLRMISQQTIAPDSMDTTASDIEDWGMPPL